MGDVLELLLTSDISSGAWTACLWDYNTGTCVHRYRKGGTLNPHAFAFLGNQYLIAAERAKPLLHVWPLNGQETLRDAKVVCPGNVLALSASPDGYFCAAGIGEQLHLWQTSSGQLLSAVSKHFQPITVVRFTSDGSYVITGGEDGLVLVWCLSRLTNMSQNNDQNDPLHVLSEHSLPVRDLWVGTGASRLMSVSADCTLKIHELSSGELLLSVAFDCGLTSVTSNATETSVFVGTSNGMIHQVSLINPSRNRVQHGRKGTGTIFKGHDKSISSLTVSADGASLASGSVDSQVIIWHIASGQKLRTLSHSGPISNVMFTTAIKDGFNNDAKPSLVFTAFERNVTSEDVVSRSIQVLHRDGITLPFDDTTFEDVQWARSSELTNIQKEISAQSEVERLKAINLQLFEFCRDCILENSNNTLETNGNIDTTDDNPLKFNQGLFSGSDEPETKKVKPNKKKRKMSKCY